MVSASAMALGSVPAMAATDSAKTESAQNDSKEDAEASNEKEADAAKTDTLEDGVYTAEFDTDSSMFHVNEACNGRATLTVKDGKMTVHITLVSKNIENVFLGTAEDAQKIQKKQVCYASHEHEEFVVHVEKTIHLISLLFFWILF